MIVGEAQRDGLNDMLAFGQPGDTDPADEQHATARAAVEAIRRLGIPDSISLEWYLEH
jgi:hypothetical protein